jgi:hypothetical protein
MDLVLAPSEIRTRSTKSTAKPSCGGRNTEREPGCAPKYTQETEFLAARGEKTVEPNLAKNKDSMNPPANETRPWKTKSAESSAHKFPGSSRHTEHKTQPMLAQMWENRNG